MSRANLLHRLGASIDMLRPRTQARTRKSLDDLHAEAQDTRRTLKQLLAGQQNLQASAADVMSRLESLSGQIRTLQQQVTTLSLRESQLRAVIRADAARQDSPDATFDLGDETLLTKHIRSSVADAELHLTPFPYALVRNVFPEDFYQALLGAIPPVELFGDRPFNKQQLTVPFALAPAHSRRVWNLFVYRVGPRMLQPALVKKFRRPLEEWIASNWPALGSDPLAPPMEFSMAEGRILLRGRGYRINPHRDPKWGFLTGILYLARDGDSESWGTQLYSVAHDRPAQGAAPHWIDAAECRLEAEIPFARNTMLVFLNSIGAHGAHIPEDAQPANLQRYIYQFRIGPSASAARTLMATLPKEQVSLWTGKVSDY